jgi:hypothetical protein
MAQPCWNVCGAQSDAPSTRMSQNLVMPIEIMSVQSGLGDCGRLGRSDGQPSEIDPMQKTHPPYPLGNPQDSAISTARYFLCRNHSTSA